jgi:hypothetical protein
MRSLCATPGGRRHLVRELLEHPFYLQLAAPRRLELIKRLEAGSSLSVALLRLDMHQWLKTGVLT